MKKSQYLRYLGIKKANQLIHFFYHSCIKDLKKYILYNKCINVYIYRLEANIITKKSKDILAINMKYFRYESKLSQEKFAEALDTNLVYENQMEKGKRNPSLDMLDKISDNISILLGYKVSSAELISYDENKVIYSKRVDEKKK